MGFRRRGFSSPRGYHQSCPMVLQIIGCIQRSTSTFQSRKSDSVELAVLQILNRDHLSFKHSPGPSQELPKWQSRTPSKQTFGLFTVCKQRLHLRNQIPKGPHFPFRGMGGLPTSRRGRKHSEGRGERKEMKVMQAASTERRKCSTMIGMLR